MQTQEKLVAEKLVFLDFSSSVDHNTNNEAFGNNRSQSKNTVNTAMIKRVTWYQQNNA
jgi:hypothetical protein